MTAATWAAFLAAAAIGAPLRYLVDGWVQDRTSGSLPWGTLTVNLTGCLALGLLVGLGRYHHVGPSPITALGTGGLGAYTTFGTFTFETVRLAEEGALADALRNVGATLAASVAAAAMGLAVMAAI